LRELEVEYEFRDTAKEPLSAAEIGKLIGDGPVLDVLNARSTPFRKRGLDGKKISKAQAIRLIREDVNFLKRPILVKGKKKILGKDEEAYRKL
jgi:arsenate reductase-like glutaredoxin family protein